MSTLEQIPRVVIGLGIPLFYKIKFSHTVGINLLNISRPPSKCFSHFALALDHHIIIMIMEIGYWGGCGHEQGG